MKGDQQIIDFINEQHLLSLATRKGNTAYCCNIFYAYDAESTLLC
jgi:uncharacterized protein YhbP (UPF0306 family)